MKKTLTVNLGGTVFHIDEDAYRLLDNYLCNLKLHFRRQAGADEIVNDIELRISELFLEKLTAGSQVITITDVEEVINRMGKPEEMETGKRILPPVPEIRKVPPVKVMVPALGIVIIILLILQPVAVCIAIRTIKCWVA